MSTISLHPPASREYLLHSTEALLAGTLALMTAVAQGSSGAQRQAVLRKVQANLAQLARHPGVSSQFRAVAVQLQQHWAAVAGPADAAADTPLWPAGPATLQ